MRCKRMTHAHKLLFGFDDSITQTVGGGVFILYLLNSVYCFASVMIHHSVLHLVCLRLQSNEDNQSLFKGITPERAFGDFIFAHVILHLVVINFIG